MSAHVARRDADHRRASAVSATDLDQPGAVGILNHGQGGADTLVLDRVGKDKHVDERRHDHHRRLAGAARSCRRSSRATSRSASSRASARTTPTSTSRSRCSRSSTSRRSQSVLVLVPKKPLRCRDVDALKAAVALFVAALVQVSILGLVHALRRHARPRARRAASRSRCCAARSSAPSPASGAGLLLDTANLGTLGFTSLLLTLAGFWIGRYGETTARDRFHAPFRRVAVVTILYALGALALRLRARRAGAGAAPRSPGCPRRVLLNLILTLPVYALVRRLFPPLELSTASRGAAPWLARPSGRRAASCRGDPRVEEPYRADAAARRCASRSSGSSRSPSSPCSSCASGRCRCSRATSTCARGAEQPAAHAAGSRRRAGRSSTATAACSSRTSPARASSSGRPTCRRRGRAQRDELARSRSVVGVPPQELLTADQRAHGRSADAGRDPARRSTTTRSRTSHEHQIEFPGRPARRAATCATTPTSRSPPRCSATSARSRRTS